MKTLKELEDKLKELNKAQESDKEMMLLIIDRISARAGLIELSNLERGKFLSEQNNQLINALENTKP